jgi:hypothetical protein
MKKQLFLLMIILASPVFLFAQTGIIQGIVIDKTTRETLVGVNILIEGSTTGASTDLNGEFIIERLKPGIYNLAVSMISYSKTLINDVNVSRDNVTFLNIELQEEAQMMQEVVIVDRRKTEMEISIINTIKNTNLVANGISSQQILKSQDRDASEVIRRIPGVTIFNGRFIVVRGLNQRYNSVWLNNASTPSSEADSRAFSFDIIPSSLLDNIMVYKTPAAEIPADFSGAFIDVSTRNNPNQNTTEISYNASVREHTTFNDYYKYQGSPTDFLGFDNGTRALPEDFPETNEFKDLSNTYTPEAMELVTRYGREINKVWTADMHNAIFDNRFNVALNRRFRIGATDVGFITALNYTNTNLYLPIQRMDYQVYNFEEDKPVLNFDFYDDQYTTTAKTGILFNWSFALKNSGKITFQNLFNQIGYSRTTLRQGTEYYSSQTIRAFEYAFLSRTTYSGQLGGEHHFGRKNGKLNWTAGYSYTYRNEPNQKRLTTILNTTQGDPHFNEYGLAIGNTASPKYAGIVYQTLNEHLAMVKLDFTQPFKLGRIAPELKAGIYGEGKFRTFDARLLGFVKSHEDLFNQDIPYMPFDSIFQDRNINQTDGIKLSESTNPSDSYTAENLQAAGYVSLKIPYVKWSTILAGLRIEENSQVLHSYSSDLSSVPVNFNLTKLDFFPSVNITFDLNRKSLIRAAYGRTVNRPEFREIAPFNFYVFTENASFVGNPNLTNAYVHNVDVRYELYPSVSEMFSAGLFYKNFIHPIEITYLNSGSGLAYQPINAKGAYNYGIEVELRKTFSFLENKGAVADFFSDFTLVLNASYIRSQVQFVDTALERNRYMQGQSPYIINAGLYYQHEKTGWSSSLLFNVMGKRIIIVGQPNQDPREDIPDMYELPFNSLDFTLSKKFGTHWQVKGGIQNILNQTVQYRQTVEFEKAGEGNVKRYQPTLSFKPGRYYTLGIGFSF